MDIYLNIDFASVHVIENHLKEFGLDVFQVDDGLHELVMRMVSGTSGT